MSRRISSADIEGHITLPVIPLPDAVPFPGEVLAIRLGRLAAARTSHAAPNRHQRVALLPRLNRAGTPGPDGRTVHYHMAVEGEHLLSSRTARVTATVFVRALNRVKLLELSRRGEELVGLFARVRDTGSRDVEAEALSLIIRDMLREIASAQGVGDTASNLHTLVRNPSRLSDALASVLGGSHQDQLALLGSTNVADRLRRLHRRLLVTARSQNMQDSIDQRVADRIGKQQQELMLRHHMIIIERELASAELAADDMDNRVASPELPAEVARTARTQYDRLKQIPSELPEHSIARSYLDWLVDLPWTRTSGAEPDVDRARRVLDADHYGIEDAKRRILEHLAVRKLKHDHKGTILCLVGPPGVGKSSLAHSVARALSRSFVHLSLGGMRDVAEIRGHRRTYVGAQPGRILQEIRRAGSSDPVFLLDEIDKVGQDVHGDPTSALLEVLDPEQNHEFVDHYIDLPFDLSRVMFIATANEEQPIPASLRDRLEIIELRGYTRLEKQHIAANHLVGKQLAEHGLDAQSIAIAPDALTTMIDHYTEEAGVRGLEREIAAICRHLAVGLARDGMAPRRVAASDLAAILGPVRHLQADLESQREPGVASSLAATPTGGKILLVESTLMVGQGKLIISGKLGDVMQEAARAAATFAKTHALQLGIDPSRLTRTDVHIHVPAADRYKDGSSMGLPMVASLVSLLTGRRVLHDVALAGEVTLRGRLLAVDRVRDRVVAGHRAGLRRIVLPERNRKDLLDIPEEVRSRVEIMFVSTAAEALELAIEPKSARRRRKSVGGTPDGRRSRRGSGAGRPSIPQPQLARPPRSDAKQGGSRD